MGTRIGVIGIGGVGGYFGGLLAKAYKDNDQAEICFIARSITSSIIKRNGLKLITPEGTETVFPAIVSNDAVEIGKLDVLIIAVKSYDLEGALQKIAPCITRNTIILPLLNGVGAKDSILQLYPNNLVLDGCVFVISKILESGVIERIAGKGTLFFGSEIHNQRLEDLHQLFLAAGINAKYAPNILEVVWGKFMFISTLASITSYLDITTGEIIENKTYLSLLEKLLVEFKAVATTQSIELSENIIQEILQKIAKLPYETTTSMQRDFQQGKRTEYFALTKYIVDLGEENRVEIPTYKMVLEALIIKSDKLKI